MSLAGSVVLVTGGSGFLGSHLVEALLQRGADVHLISRARARSPHWRALAARCVSWPAGLEDVGALARCFREARPGLVIHLAGDTGGRTTGAGWTDLAGSLGVNLGGTLAMLQAAAESGAPVVRFIRAGGLAEYGSGPVPFRESQREEPRSPYAASQVATTHCAEAFSQALPFSLVTLRLALLYGPRQSETFLLPRLIRCCLRGEPLPMTDGHQGRDMLHVDDAVEAIARAATVPGLGNARINICSGLEVTVRELATLVEQLAGVEGIARFGNRPYDGAEMHRMLGDPSLAGDLLAWSASIPLAEGLQRTIAWHRDQGPGTEGP